MQDRSAASVGVVLAGFALAAAGLSWDAPSVGTVETAVLAALAATAFGAFSLRRRDLLDRVRGSLLAGSASLGVVGYVGVATAGVVAGDGPAVSPWATALAFVGGFGGVIAAYGDGRGVPQSVGRALKAVGWSLGVGFAGLFAITVWTSVLWGLASGLLSGEPGTTYRLALGAVALGLGTGTVALVYFRWTDRSLSYLDFRMPNARDVGYFVTGIVGLFALQVAVSVVFSQLGASTANHSVEQAAQSGDADVLLLLIPASWLIIGPGEELLYRNIIQKSLYDTFGEWGAVVVASVVFALAHILAYASGATLVALFNTLLVIFFLSLILGGTYLKTDNLTVSAAIHGTFDAVVFAAMYVQITGGL